MRITIRQFQELDKATKYELPELEKSILLVKILTGKNDFEIEKMPIRKFNKVCMEINKAFNKLNATIDKEKPRKYAYVKGRTYLIHYDISQINAGRYVEIATFQTDIIGNLHKIMASLVTPMKLTWKGLKAQKYDGAQHQKIAEELLDMDFSVAYHACVFFYALFLKSIENLNIYGNQLEAVQAARLQSHLVNYLDGTITADWYRNLNQLN